MEIIVSRDKNNGDTTIGRMFIDGEFECWTLEDQPNEKKVYGETRIPAGTYEVKLRTEGTTHEAYKKRFQNVHKGTLHLQDIPGFKYVLIHIGNTDEDTLGCILVGNSVKDWKLVDSTKAYLKMYQKVSEALLEGEKVTITLQDND